MPTPEALEQAKIALRNFRALQPTLTQYARMLTGRPDVRVVAHERSNGQTDGKVIYFRPPISLGKEIAHQKWKCDRRDKTGQMKCKSCAQREDVLATIYHEIAHIWFDSFEELSEDAKRRAIQEAIAEHGTVYSDKIKAKVAGLPSYFGYLDLSRVVSPFMPLLLNALEDARVNRKLFEALPGTKIMFDASTAKIFCDGVEQLDSKGQWEHQKWSERPLNMQALIGVFCMASGYDFSTWLDEYVVTCLSDDTLVALVRKMDDAHTVENTFTVAFPILARLRELGFCRNEEDPEDDYVPPFDEENGESDDESDDEADDADSSPESGTGDSESSDDPADGDDGTGEDESGSESGEGDDEQQEAGSERSDSESGDDGDTSDEPGSSDDASQASEEEGELDEDSDGGDSGERGPEGPSADSDETGDDVGSDSSGDSDSPSDGEHEDEDEVPEADNSSDDGAGESSGSSDSDDLRDGDGADAGNGDLDGPDDPISGDAEPDELGRDDSTLGGSPGEPNTGEGTEAAELDEPVDLGSDRKAIRVEGEIKRPKKPDLPWGDAEDAKIAIVEIGEHAPDAVHVHEDDDSPHGHTHAEDSEGDEAVKVVLMSGAYFEQPSSVVMGVNFHNEKSGYFTDEYERFPESTRVAYGIDGEFDPHQSMINPVVTRARVVFAANARGRNELNLKRGRVHSPSLGMKAPIGDPTMFRQRRLPQRIDYFVGIGIDVSGSTVGKNIVLAKQVAFAEAEVLAQLGVPFFMYAHHGQPNWDDSTVPLDIVEIKTAEEPWNDKTRDRLRKLQPGACNLDGHTIQYYRKMLERQRGKKKILHYYSDGAMPAENYEEELEILQKEIQTYKKQDILLTGVGIRCDSPRQHGLHTVQVDEQKDVMNVIVDLEQQLTRIR